MDHLFQLFAGQIQGPIVSHVHSVVRGGMVQGSWGKNQKGKQYLSLFFKIELPILLVLSPAQGFLFDTLWVEGFSLCFNLEYNFKVEEVAMS